MIVFYKENPSIIGKARRLARSVRQYIDGVFVPAFIDVTTKMVVAGMIMLVIATIVTKRERSSGPAASLSPSPYISSDTTSCSTGHDSYTIASRAGHGQFAGAGR